MVVVIIDTIDNPTSSHQETTEEPSEISEAQPIEVKQDVVKGEELMCLCENEQEAKEIATLYEIDFVYFANGVATFTTDKDLGEVIQKGKDNCLAFEQIEAYKVDPKDTTNTSFHNVVDTYRIYKYHMKKDL